MAEINLASGISNTIDNKLDAAIEAFLADNAEQRNDAVNKMQSFINYTEAQRGKKINDVNAGYLVDDAENIIQLFAP